MLETFQVEAQLSLLGQASTAFAMQPSLEKIILVGSSGDWWTWKIITRSSIDEIVDDNSSSEMDNSSASEIDNSPLSEMESSDDDCYPTAFPRKNKIRRRGKFMESSPPILPSISEDESSVPYRKPVSSGKAKRIRAARSKINPTFYSHDDLAEKNRETELKAVNIDTVEQKRTASWSSNILYGTRVSNQQLYIIHQLLQMQTRGLEMRTDFWNVSIIFITQPDMP